jgi:hypothetical protein
MSHACRAALPVALGLFLATAGPGCGGAGGSSEYTAGGAKVKVLHPPSGLSRSSGKTEGDFSETTFTWGDGERGPSKVVVGHGRLQIDGRDYGPLNKGNEAVIDARQGRRRVTVNGAERKPAEGDAAGKDGGPQPAG